MAKKIFITGGHLTPAVSMIEKLEEKGGWKIYYIGRTYSKTEDSSYGIEKKTIERYKNVTYLTINPGKLKRYLSFSTFLSLIKVPFGFIDSLKLLNTYKPDVVLSFGGYVALPIAITAHAFKIPVITHEQTNTTGSANAMIENVAVKVCFSWNGDGLKNENKEVLTGLPLRKEIYKDGDKLPVSLNKPLIYISGGSQGSHAINNFVAPIIEKLVKKYSIIHQCGDNKTYGDYEKMMDIKNSLPKALQDNYLPVVYIDSSSIGWVYRHTKLAVSRSGANSVYEFAAIGIPSIFIPLPFSSREEQLKNAQFFSTRNAGIVLQQNETNSDTLFIAIEEMMKKIRQFKDNAKTLKKDIILNGDDRLCSVLQKVVS